MKLRGDLTQVRNILQPLHLRLRQLLNLIKRHVPERIISPPTPLRMTPLQSPRVPSAPWSLLSLRWCILFIVSSRRGRWVVLQLNDARVACTPGVFVFVYSLKALLPLRRCSLRSGWCALRKLQRPVEHLTQVGGAAGSPSGELLRGGLRVPRFIAGAFSARV